MNDEITTPGDAVPSRRRFLRVATTTGAAVALSTVAGVPAVSAVQAAPSGAGGPGGKKLRVYVLVVDGLRPDEIAPDGTPHLYALRAEGTNFPQARALPVMETLPNHVMMMTGVRPDRSGVPANDVYDREEGAVRTLDRPSDIRVPTLLERVADTGRVSGSVLSKEYLYTIFGERASVRWEPEPLIPITDHAPDLATKLALSAMVEETDPDLVLVNLGDVDRVGHADLTGTSLGLLRAGALSATDAYVGRFVDELRSSGRWESSVVMVIADHSMDWSHAHKVISLQAPLEADEALAGRVAIAQNGGADLLTFTGKEADRAAAVARMREIAAATPGVLSVHRPGSLRLAPDCADLVVYCKAGWRFSDPSPISNPIPGNHGHPATEPIPFFIAGGHPRVRKGVTSSAPATTVDVAPTVGELFGLPPVEGGYDGEIRREALFSRGW
ncbi:alkaline phosphatase family protein [Prauserella alba]|uniref:Tat (Twin-arginine translocation) pathway signal sequence n=1 Tax=Prauserella alba TaxID=176898 RepID=A0ABN1VHX5_9PSEU|nr:alkaline phosphatase family protein [Prauserella alba]MCP2180518.1 putative pyrophosphatase or phosphodiesterase, AlkP superfamily [Prauserella alba]